MGLGRCVSSCAAQHASGHCEERSPYESWCAAHCDNELSHGESAVVGNVAEAQRDIHARDRGCRRDELVGFDSAVGRSYAALRAGESSCAALHDNDFRGVPDPCVSSCVGRDQYECFGDSVDSKRFDLYLGRQRTSTNSISDLTSEAPEN